MNIPETRSQLEQIAEKIHKKWIINREAQGWKYGIERNSNKKETPCFVPYEELPENEKEYDRELAKTTIATIEELGVKIVNRNYWYRKKANKQLLAEFAAKNLHQRWMQMRKEAGWKYGEQYDDNKLTHPNLKEFDDLSKDEKKIDIDTAKVTINELGRLGYSFYVEGCPNRNGRMWIDKILVKPIIAQVFYLGLILVALIAFFVGLGLAINTWYGSHLFSELPNVSNSTPDILDKVWYVFLRLFDAGSIKDSQPSLFLIAIILTGWILCGGFLIAIITNGYFERIKKIEKGIARYKLKDHCVIIGSDNIHLNIIRNIRNGKHKKHSDIDCNCKVVVFSSKDSEEIRNKLKAFLTAEEEKNIIIYRGDRTSKDHLKNLWLHTASEIFVLGENSEMGSDSMNIACISIIEKILSYYISNKKQVVKPKPCSVLLDDLRTYDLITEVELGGKRSLLELSHFNTHDSWSSKLFSDNFSGFRLIKEQISKNWENEKASFRFVIVGFNRMGKSLLNQAIRILNLGPGQNVTISVIDIEAKQFEEKYRSRCPGYDLLENELGIKVEFNPWDIESKIARKNIENWVLDECCNLLGIAVCFQDSTLSLYNGLKLPELVETESVPVFIYQKELHGLAKSIQERNEKGNKYTSKTKLQHTSVSFFGMVTDSVYFFKERENAAELIQKRYQIFCSVLEQADKPYDEKWEELAEKDKWSNRYKTESAPIMNLILELLYNKLQPEKGNTLKSDNVSRRMSKLLEALLYFRIFGLGSFITPEPEAKNNKYALTKVKLINIGKKVRQFINKGELICDESVLDGVDETKLFEALEYISEIEHKRWMAEKITSGWSYSSTRKNEQKLHPDLKAYNKLNELTKMYDRGGFL